MCKRQSVAWLPVGSNASTPRNHLFSQNGDSLEGIGFLPAGVGFGLCFSFHYHIFVNSHAGIRRNGFPALHHQLISSNKNNYGYG